MALYQRILVPVDGSATSNAGGSAESFVGIGFWNRNIVRVFCIACINRHKTSGCNNSVEC